METGAQRLNSSEETPVAANSRGVVYFARDKEIKPHISNIVISDDKHISNIIDIENRDDDITIKEESLDEQEHSLPTEPISSNDEMESSDSYSGDQRIDHPIDKNLLNSSNKLSTRSKERESSSIELENSEDLDNTMSSYKRKENSNAVIMPNIKLYGCDVCHRYFYTESDLSIHQRIHTEEKPYICNVCDKKFRLKNYLITHERIHTGEKPHSCDVCNKKFPYYGSMLYHKRIHTCEKPFSCDICDRKFSSRSYINIHKRYHTGEKPYCCDICDKTFIHSGNWMAHKRKHTGEKPFCCDICEKTFYSKTDMSKHIITHKREKPFACEVCPKAFSHICTLRKHKRIHHSTR